VGTHSSVCSQRRPDISFGNVLGSILAFFLCNAGVIALVRPVPVDRAVLTFYLPVAVITTAVVSGLMLTKGRYFHTADYHAQVFTDTISETATVTVVASR
jgi:Ca2+/Na+ antiporter